jgi:hypothetical protein
LAEWWDVEVLQLERCPVNGGREGIDGNFDGAVHEPVAHHEEWQELRRHDAGPGAHHHCVRGANDVHLRYRQLALVGAAAAENNVTPAKAELGTDDIAALAPAADV